MYHRLKTLFSPSAATAPNQACVTPQTANQQRLLEQVERCYQIAEQSLNQRFPRPEINFKLRGKSAGTAHLQLNKLRFNPVLLEENSDEFLRQVAPHEICHLLAHQLYGRVKPHGREWQVLMVKLFSLTPHTTHSLNVESVAGKTFTYRCNCGPIPLTIRRHNKVQREQTQYRCRKCRQTLSFIGDTD
ncbi:SprT family zinc-dependent metalloprotease [Shewanella colwelliana]|uniref:SprT family zinc-dependent metalloprotease n=1 Tax=Shewanella colwelliana TaxID=23 RepID=UPI003D012E58